MPHGGRPATLGLGVRAFILFEIFCANAAFPAGGLILGVVMFFGALRHHRVFRFLAAFAGVLTLPAPFLIISVLMGT